MDAAMVGLGSPSRSRRALVLVGVLVALFVPWSAAAQVQTPLGELPVPTTLPGLLDDDGPVGPPSVTTTVPPVTTPTTVVEQPRAEPDSGSGATTAPSSGARKSSAKRSSSSGTRAVPAAGETTLIQPAVADTPDRPALARLRRVTVPAAREFGFPLVLGVFVLAFLVVQARLDARDPKLAAAPVTVDDDLLPFL